MKKTVFTFILIFTLCSVAFSQSPPPPQYSLYVDASSGFTSVTITVRSDTINATNVYPIFVPFDVPTMVTLTANNYKYPDGAADVFMMWDWDLTGYNNPETIYVDGQKSVTAVYAHGDPTPTTIPTPAPTPVGGAGDVWFVIPDQSNGGCINVGWDFTVEIHVNTGSQRLSSYSFEVLFNSNVIQVNTGIGNNGAEPGPDGFVTAMSPSGDPNSLLVTGYDATGTGPGPDLHVVTAHFYAIAVGTTTLQCIINSLQDENAVIIGTPNAINNIVSVAACAYFKGDANADHSIDIIDALLVAQYYVGLDPDRFRTEYADTNCDGNVDIVDALLIARYYVGLISEFC